MPSHHRHRSRHAQEPQPPSTLKVLSYVALVWIAWGIFTRIDETDHLRPPTALRNAATHAAHYAHEALHEGERAVEHGFRNAWDGYEGVRRSERGVYSLAFPSAPSGRTDVPPDSRGWLAMALGAMTKIVTYAIVYPCIALFNAAAFVLHYLSITFVMLLGSAYYLAYPLQQLVTSIITTFTSPLYVLASLIRYTQPLWNLAASLIGTSATLGTAFAFLSRKADAQVHAAHAQRLERERVEMLEREVARARQNADERERAAQLARRRAVAAARSPRHHRHPPSQSLLSALVDKLCGRVSPQEEYAAYVADLQLLETRQGWRDPYYGGEIRSGDEDDVAYAGLVERLMIAPPDVNPKRRHGRRSAASRGTLVEQQHQQHRPFRAPGRHAHDRRITRDTYIPNLHHHADDALPPVHTPPVDGLPPTPGRSIKSFAPSTPVPSVNLVRARRVGSGKRIMWVDQIARQVDEPVEGEVFGISDDEEEEDAERTLQMHDDERSPSGPSSLHIHFHNNPSLSSRRQRTIRFNESGIAPSGSTSVDQAQFGHMDGTPFRRSLARAASGASEGEQGRAGIVIASQERRASASDVEL